MTGVRGGGAPRRPGRRALGLVVLGLLVLGAWLALGAGGGDAPLPAAPLRPVVAAHDDAVAAGEPQRDGEALVAPLAATAHAEREPAASRSLAGGAAGRRSLRGRVEHSNGKPGARAELRLGPLAAYADERGAFAMYLGDPDGTLVVWIRGQQPAIVERVGHHPDVAAGDELVVVLQGPALAIDGIVLTAAGEPAAGWRLHLHGGGTAVDLGEPPMTVEDFANGASPRAFGLQVPHHNPNLVTLGADGAFRVGGLRAGREYVLRAWNESMLQQALSLPIRAGTSGYRFVLPRADLRERVTGRAVDRHGGALAGVRVRLTMRVSVAGGPGEPYESRNEVRTDAAGAFVFADVPRDDLLLRVEGPGVLPTQRELPATDPGVDLVVPMACACRFRFVPEPGSAAPTSLRVLDAAQQPLRVERTTGPRSTDAGTRLWWPDGDPERELVVSDAAAWLVLEQGNQELRRVPLRLVRGQVTVVRG